MNDEDDDETMADDHAAVRRRFPRAFDHPALLQSVIGLTLDESYVLDVASGNVVGDIAGTALVAAGTPTYQRHAAGRIGIYYDGAGDSHGADVHPFGTASGWIGALIEVVATTGGSRSILGRTNASAADGYLMFLGSTGAFTVLARDAGTNTSTAAGTDLLAPGDVAFCQLQIDRAAGRVRGRFARLTGTVEAIEASISGFATLDGESQAFGPGSRDGVPGAAGINVLWAGVATGAQCAGDGLLAAISGRVGLA